MTYVNWTKRCRRVESGHEGKMREEKGEVYRKNRREESVGGARRHRQNHGDLETDVETHGNQTK